MFRDVYAILVSLFITSAILKVPTLVRVYVREKLQDPWSLVKRKGRFGAPLNDPFSYSCNGLLRKLKWLSKAVVPNNTTKMKIQKTNREMQKSIVT